MNKNILRVLTILLGLILFLSIKIDAFANNLEPINQVEIEKLDNGDYMETFIESEDSLSSVMSSTKTITKTKTTDYKSSSGEVLWSVSIKATFTYDGKTSKCTSCSHNATSFSKGWSIKSCTSSKSGNKATATVVAVHKMISANTFTKTITISCSPKGVVS